MARTSERLRVLLLGSNEEETRLLREALSRETELAAAWSPEELFGLLPLASYDAFLCDRDSQEGAWREVCVEVKRKYPDLPIIVLSRCGGEKEWVEALEVGCFDLVCAPYFNRQILSVIEHAVASRRDQGFLKVVA